MKYHLFFRLNASRSRYRFGDRAKKIQISLDEARNGCTVEPLTPGVEPGMCEAIDDEITKPIRFPKCY